jgi:cobalamin-dependent methionine synthase I
MVRPIGVEAFGVVYAGEGANDCETPVGAIAPRARALALFAATLGEAITAHIASLFASGEPALGYMLDAVASTATDALADAAAGDLRRRLSADGTIGAADLVLPYSPGYCGWHITGQRALFAALEPAAIGVALNPSCLMQPLKSVSGVLVAGAPALHAFYPDFPACNDCGTRQCQDRVARLDRA